MRIQLLLLLAFLTITASAYHKLEALQHVPINAPDQTHEVLYLPNGKGLNAISFGYHNIVSNLLWFNTISYFGKHYASDQNYQWFSHMCDLVTTLDPQATHVYEFCALMLAWEAHTPEAAIEILTKAIKHHPQEWLFPYLRGFDYMFFVKNATLAKRDLLYASKLPGAPLIAGRLAARQATKLGDYQSAVAFLSDVISKTTNPTTRAALQKRLKQTRRDYDLEQLKKAISYYYQHHQGELTDLQQLVDAGIIKQLPPDPFGGRYYIDAKTNELKSSSLEQEKDNGKGGVL